MDIWEDESEFEKILLRSYKEDSEVNELKRFAIRIKFERKAK